MNAALRQCLMDLDVEGARAIWRHVAPHLPQPASDAAALATMHVARTATQTIPPRLRFYSHRWLLDHGYPSQLPDRLKPSAERMYPRKVEAVGIALAGRSGPEACAMIRGAMEHAVLDCFANGDTATEIVKPQMMAARFRERKALGLPRHDDIPAEWRP